MAAYAALVSLLNNMEQIMSHPHLSTSLDKDQIESLAENIDFLLDFLQSYNGKEVEDLEGQIASGACAAEDVIESHIADRILSKSSLLSSFLFQSRKRIKSIKRKVMDVQKKIRSKVDKSNQQKVILAAGSTVKSSSFLINLQKVIADMASIKEHVMEIMEKRGFEEEQPTHSTSVVLPSRPLTNEKISLVGFDEELIQLMDVLTGQQSSRQIISIVGMGGSGKTTLARNVYENSLIMQHFDVCAWATISQQYNVREILLELLTFQGNFTNQSVDELGERLYKSLSGRRYLIILDDMWSIDVWDKMKFFFPDNGCRSRVVITTRLSNVGNSCGSPSFRMNFLDEDKSWNLFCRKVFGQEECPPELVKIGKKIVEQCRGLPLSIVVIGGVLRKSNRTKRYWQHVARNIYSRENEQCLDMLYLSYSHLPAHLKPCFLYMGVFEEDYEFRVSEIIKLWVAEGLIKQNGSQILEEIAEDYFEDLVDRNLILVCTYRPNGKIKSCRMHDLLRELCLRVARREKLFCYASMYGIPQGIDRERCLIFHGVFRGDRHKVFKAFQSESITHSLIVEEVLSPIKFRFLGALNKANYKSREAKFQNVNLRYFAFQPRFRCWSYVLPSSISLIWNLQTLIIEDVDLVVAPLEIWKMSQLRHVKCSDVFLPKGDESVVLGNLQTLGRVVDFEWNDEACKRIPNIKKLCLAYSYANDRSRVYNRMSNNLHNLGHLHKLESLNIRSLTTICYPPQLEMKNVLPSSLKSLSLEGFSLHQEDLTTIGSLPQLKVLKLKDINVVGNVWSPVEGEFLRLKYLSVDECDVRSWEADSSHFPVLEKLVFRETEKLKEIPLGMGEIATLKLIQLERCNEDMVISAMKIGEEVESMGNDGLQIQVLMFAERRRKLMKEWKLRGCRQSIMFNLKIGRMNPCNFLLDNGPCDARTCFV